MTPQQAWGHQKLFPSLDGPASRWGPEELAQAPAKLAPAPYTGVKKRIAVAKFDAGGTYATHFTG